MDMVGSGHVVGINVITFVCIFIAVHWEEIQVNLVLTPFSVCSEIIWKVWITELGMKISGDDCKYVKKDNESERILRT